MSRRIMVVDDEIVVLGAVRKALKTTGYAIDCFENAEDALKAFRTNRYYDLVITDLMMPGLGGIELIRQLRALSSPPQVIVITGYPIVQTALRARHLDVFEYVDKPFTRQELVGAVLRALGDGAGREE